MKQPNFGADENLVLDGSNNRVLVTSKTHECSIDLLFFFLQRFSNTSSFFVEHLPRPLHAAHLPKGAWSSSRLAAHGARAHQHQRWQAAMARPALEEARGHSLIRFSQVTAHRPHRTAGPGPWNGRAGTWRGTTRAERQAPRARPTRGLPGHCSSRPRLIRPHGASARRASPSYFQRMGAGPPASRSPSSR